MSTVKGPWQKFQNSAYLANTDFLNDDGTNKPEKKLKIKTVLVEKIGGDQEEKLVVYFEGVSKGWVPAKTCLTVISSKYGNLVQDWDGKAVTIFRDKCKAFGETVGCIRVKV